MLAAVPTQMVETWGVDQAHGVQDGEARGYVAARAVDIEADVAVPIFAFQVEELGDDDVGDLIGDGRAQINDALTEEQRIDVEGALATGAGLNDHGDDIGRLEQGGNLQKEVPLGSPGDKNGSRTRMGYGVRRLRGQAHPGVGQGHGRTMPYATAASASIQ